MYTFHNEQWHGWHTCKYGDQLIKPLITESCGNIFPIQATFLLCSAGKAWFDEMAGASQWHINWAFNVQGELILDNLFKTVYAG